MNQARGASEWEDIYGSQAAPATQLMQLPLKLLDPWKDSQGHTQPFRQYTKTQLEDLTENIRENGVITPIHVRPMGRRFQILAGHNRCMAASRAGLTTVPAIVEEVSDDAAAIILVDSNLHQREQLLPSEKAFAYKMKLEAIKHQGRRSSSLVEPRMRSDAIVAQNVPESRAGVQRYIRLTKLIPELLDRVDNKTLSMDAANIICSLPVGIQATVAEAIADRRKTISTAQAKAIRDTVPTTVQAVQELLVEPPKPPRLNISITLPGYAPLAAAQIKADPEFQKEAQRLLQVLVEQTAARLSKA